MDDVGIISAVSAFEQVGKGQSKRRKARAKSSVDVARVTSSPMTSSKNWPHFVAKEASSLGGHVSS